MTALSWDLLWNVSTELIVGLPVLLLSTTWAAWMLWDPTEPYVPSARRPTWADPNGEPFSRAFYALYDRVYSGFVAELYDRLDRASVARLGSRVPDLPILALGADVGAPVRFSAVRRLGERLSTTYTRAIERERGAAIRWAFWRSAGEDARRFRGRLETLAHETEMMVRILERGYGNN